MGVTTTEKYIQEMVRLPDQEMFQRFIMTNCEEWRYLLPMLPPRIRRVISQVAKEFKDEIPGWVKETHPGAPSLQHQLQERATKLMEDRSLSNLFL